MDIMNVLRTGMNMSISRIHVWLCNIYGSNLNWVKSNDLFWIELLEIELFDN